MADYAAVGPATGEVIANKEIKAWLSRLDGKGVDVLLVADSCFGGGMVRGLPDPRAGTPLLRVAKNIAPQGTSAFAPMPMTTAELHANVADLPHVTVLSGADRFTPVPEVFIPSPPTRRGALSYAVARALRGNAAHVGSDVTTRRELFTYARQEVQHYSDDQRIDNSPRASADDLTMLDRPVFRVQQPLPVTAVASTPMPNAASCAVKLAVINDDSDARSRIEDAGVPFQIVADPRESELVWDVRAAQVIQSSGDVIASDIGPAQIAGVIARTSAVQCIKDLTDIRPQRITLNDGIKRYTPKDNPALEAEDVDGRRLIVFDLAADGRLQVVWPPKDRDPPMTRQVWTARPDVVAPFGADYVVAVSSSADLGDFLDWLNSHDNSARSVAAQVPAWLRAIQSRDVTSRIGAVAFYTGSN